MKPSSSKVSPSRSRIALSGSSSLDPTIKNGGELLPLLESSGGSVYRVVPQVAFGQDEHAENFVQSATRWKFE